MCFCSVWNVVGIVDQGDVMPMCPCFVKKRKCKTFLFGCHNMYVDKKLNKVVDKTNFHFHL